MCAEYLYSTTDVYLVYAFEVTVSSLEDFEGESKVNIVEEQPEKPSNNVTEQPRKPRRQRKDTALTFLTSHL